MARQVVPFHLHCGAPKVWLLDFLKCMSWLLDEVLLVTEDVYDCIYGGCSLDHQVLNLLTICHL